MLAYRQAFASFSVLRNLQLYSSTNGGGAMRPTSEYCFQADYSWAITLYYRCGTHRPHLCLSLRVKDRVVQPARLHISHAHDVGKNTGCCHIGTGAIALNEHGVFVVALGGEQ